MTVDFATSFSMENNG